MIRYETMASIFVDSVSEFVKLKNGLNLREGPSTYHDKITTLKGDLFGLS